MVHIFSQDPVDAYNRGRYFAEEQHEGHLKEYEKRYEKAPTFVHKIKAHLKKDEICRKTH